MAVRLLAPYFSVLSHSNHSSFVFSLSLILYKSHFQAETKMLPPLEFPGSPVDENLPVNAEVMGSTPDSGRSHMPRTTQPVRQQY